MKIGFVTENGRIKIEVDGTHKEIFEEIASAQEVFDNTKCGVCGSEDVRFVVRSVDDNNFYEIQCRAKGCRAKLAFGVHKKGDTLFPKRKNEDGSYSANGGWHKYIPKSE